MTLELEIHEEPFTGKLTNLLRGFCYVVRCEKEIPRDARYADGIQAMGWIDPLTQASHNNRNQALPGNPMHISLRHRGTEYDLLELAFGHGTPKKAFLTALVIGTILTTINHGDNIILHGEWPVFWKIILTYCTPYCVTTWGAITGKLSRRKNSTPNRPDEDFATK